MKVILYPQNHLDIRPDELGPMKAALESDGYSVSLSTVKMRYGVTWWEVLHVWLPAGSIGSVGSAAARYVAKKIDERLDGAMDKAVDRAIDTVIEQAKILYKKRRADKGNSRKMSITIRAEETGELLRKVELTPDGKEDSVTGPDPEDQSGPPENNPSNQD